MRCLHSFFNQFIRIEKTPVVRLQHTRNPDASRGPGRGGGRRGRRRGLGCARCVLTQSTVSFRTPVGRPPSSAANASTRRFGFRGRPVRGRGLALALRVTASTPLTSLQLLRDDACQIGLQSRPVQKTCSKVQSPQAHEVEPTLGIHRTMPTDAAFNAFCNLCQVTKSCCHVPCLRWSLAAHPLEFA